MATYNNNYSMNFKAASPMLRGLDTNYDNTGQKNLKGIGLGDLFQLDYDRDKIEQIFNQGTDAQYALMQKENQIAQNNFVNNQFQNQQSMMESLRQQRNNQISSGMAKGLAAAADQGTILGLQQDNSQAALDLANKQQTEADKIAAEYAQNVVDALKEANSVKEAIANISAQLYEADMLGYTGELSYLGQMDANASNRYGAELGLEGSKYAADKGLEGTRYQANKNYESTKYSADKNLEGSKYQANKNLEGTKYSADKSYASNKYAADKSYAGQKYAADQSAAAQKAAAQITANSYRASGGGGGTGSLASDADFIQYCYKSGKTYEGMVAALQAGNTYTEAQARAIANQYFATTSGISYSKPSLNTTSKKKETKKTNFTSAFMPDSGGYNVLKGLTTNPYNNSSIVGKYTWINGVPYDSAKLIKKQ